MKVAVFKNRHGVEQYRADFDMIDRVSLVNEPSPSGQHSIYVSTGIYQAAIDDAGYEEIVNALRAISHRRHVMAGQGGCTPQNRFYLLHDSSQPLLHFIPVNQVYSVELIPGVTQAPPALSTVDTWMLKSYRETGLHLAMTSAHPSTWQTVVF